MSTHTHSTRGVVAIVVAVVGFLAAIIAIAAAKKLGYIEALEAKRMGAIAIGGVLIVAGNIAPKLKLFSGQGFDAGRVAGAERAAGWTLVLAGLAFVGLWLFAPSDNLMVSSSLAGLVAFGLVGAIWARLALSPRDAAPESNPTAQAKRMALAQILFALFWVFAIFLADSLWGDEVSRWMAMGYIVLAGFIATPGLRGAKRADDSPASE